jgi:hypothetical protein
LHDSGTQSDKANNRQFFFDHYVALLLLYFFNPVLTSRNAILQASHLARSILLRPTTRFHRFVQRGSTSLTLLCWRASSPNWPAACPTRGFPRTGTA